MLLTDGGEITLPYVATPAVPATAIDGVGVWETQGLILRQVFENLREEHRSTRQNA